MYRLFALLSIADYTNPQDVYLAVALSYVIWSPFGTHTPSTQTNYPQWNQAYLTNLKQPYQPPSTTASNGRTKPIYHSRSINLDQRSVDTASVPPGTTSPETRHPIAQIDNLDPQPCACKIGNGQAVGTRFQFTLPVVEWKNARTNPWTGTRMASPAISSQWVT